MTLAGLGGGGSAVRVSPSPPETSPRGGFQPSVGWGVAWCCPGSWHMPRAGGGTWGPWGMGRAASPYWCPVPACTGVQCQSLMMASFCPYWCPMPFLHWSQMQVHTGAQCLPKLVADASPVSTFSGAQCQPKVVPSVNLYWWQLPVLHRSQMPVHTGA